MDSNPPARSPRERKLVAALPAAIFLAAAVLAATSATADDIYPPETAAIAPCVQTLKDTSSTVPIEVCFYDPGDALPVAGFASGWHTASVERWKYKVPTPLSGFDAGDVIVPCVVVSYTNPGSNPTTADPCDAVGDRFELEDSKTLYVYTYDPPELGILGYLVEMRLNVTVGGYGVVEQDSLLFCRDRNCNYL